MNVLIFSLPWPDLATPIKYILEKLFMLVLYNLPQVTLAKANAPTRDNSGCGTCAISSQKSNMFCISPGGLNKSLGLVMLSVDCVNKGAI